MSYNTKNYQENGDKLVIGGTLKIEDGAVITGIPAATSTTIGGIKASTKGTNDTVEIKINSSNSKLYAPAYPKALNQVASTAAELADLKSDFNDLLTKLKTAGLMEADSENQ